MKRLIAVLALVAMSGCGRDTGWYALPTKPDTVTVRDTTVVTDTLRVPCPCVHNCDEHGKHKHKH